MKEKIHPNYNKTKVICTSCGAVFETGSTLKEIRVDTCSNCHPFYTGKQRFGNVAGRAETFMKKYNLKK
jgi:large subunit ribosomal protein L31